jgi:hypothetical protein
MGDSGMAKPLFEIFGMIIKLVVQKCDLFSIKANSLTA